MSLYKYFDKIFSSNDLKERNGISYYFEGVPDEKDEYTNHLVRAINNDKINFIYNLEMDNSKVSPLVQEIKSLFKFKDLSQERFIVNKCLDKLSEKSDEIKSSFNFVLQEYKKYESKTLTFDSLINFCCRMCYFIENNKQDKPTLIYYGNITKGKIYYLSFLNNLGFNTIIINTYENSPKSAIPLIENYFKPIRFKNKISDFKIPDSEIITAIETNAYKAEEQVNRFYGEEKKEISKLINVPIKTSYDDLINVWLTPRNERNGYKIINGVKYLPSIIAKINGVEENEEEFRNKMKQLMTNDTIIFKKVFELYSSNNNDCASGLLVLKENIKDILNDKLSQIDKNKYKDILISDCLLDIIQKIDKENYDPKLFVFYNDKIPIHTDIYKFYQLLGFDIVMISPSGYSGIEKLDNCNLYELPKYNSKFKLFGSRRKNIIKRLFGG